MWWLFPTTIMTLIIGPNGAYHGRPKGVRSSRRCRGYLVSVSIIQPLRVSAKVVLGHSAFGDRQTKEGGVEAKTCAALSVATCEDCRDDAT